MARICFDRIISDRYQPARAEAYRAAVQHFQANSLTMMKERNLKPQALGELHADDPFVHFFTLMSAILARTIGSSA